MGISHDIGIQKRLNSRRFVADFGSVAGSQSQSREKTQGGLQTGPESWLAMQFQYDLWRAKKHVDLARVGKVRLTD